MQTSQNWHTRTSSRTLSYAAASQRKPILVPVVPCQGRANWCQGGLLSAVAHQAPAAESSSSSQRAAAKSGLRHQQLEAWDCQDVPRDVHSVHVPPCAASTSGSSPQRYSITAGLLQDVITMFNSFPYEYDYELESSWVDGKIPDELCGTYLRNGPGLQVANTKYQRHFMDGDGCMFSLSFPGGGRMPHFRNRYIRTAGFVAEQAAGKPLFRNAFTRGAADGSPFFNPLDLNFKNVANTGVLYWAQQMWALWEVGRPYALDPHTLETLGESDMGGQVAQRLAGHYRTVPGPDGSQRCVVFGTQVTLSGMQLEVYEMDEQGTVVATTQCPLQGLDIMFIHDLLVTEHWYIAVMGPVQLDVRGFMTDYLTSQRSLGELLLYNKQLPSKVVLIPRPGANTRTARYPINLKSAPADRLQHQEHGSTGQQGPAAHVVVVDAPPFFSFHHVNAYEDPSSNQIVLDTISWENIAFDVTQYTVTPEYYTNGGCRSHLYRLVVDLPSRTISSCTQLLRRTVEFPALNTCSSTGRPYRHAYFAGDAVDHPKAWGPAQAILKVTLPDITSPAPSSPAGPQGDAAGVTTEEWSPGPRCFVQEPYFIPRRDAASEDDGWIIAGIHNAETQHGEIVILDAQRVREGPVARIRLPHALPPGLHGTWTHDYLGPSTPTSASSRQGWREPRRIRQL